MNKYEKLIEYIISEQDDLARELFHEIVVEKSRSIYENLMDETDMMGGSPVEDLVDDVTADESEMYEADDEEDMDMGMDMGGDDGAEDDLGMGDDDGLEDFGDEEGAEDEMGMDMDMGDEESEVDSEDELEGRVDDLESALDELKAEFDKIMAGEESDEGEEDESKEDEGEEDEENLVREYVEKVGLPSNKAEGHEVGKGGSVAVNKQSIVAGKNDMGGTTANLVKGGAESNPDGTSPHKANNYGTKGQGQLKGAGSYENVPGANTKGYKNRASAKKGEEGGVNKHSLEPGGN